MKKASAMLKEMLIAKQDGVFPPEFHRSAWTVAKGQKDSSLQRALILREDAPQDMVEVYSKEEGPESRAAYIRRKDVTLEEKIQLLEDETRASVLKTVVARNKDNEEILSIVKEKFKKKPSVALASTFINSEDLDVSAKAFEMMKTRINSRVEVRKVRETLIKLVDNDPSLLKQLEEAESCADVKVTIAQGFRSVNDPALYFQASFPSSVRMFKEIVAVPLMGPYGSGYGKAELLENLEVRATDESEMNLLLEACEQIFKSAEWNYINRDVKIAVNSLLRANSRANDPNLEGGKSSKALIQLRAVTSSKQLLHLLQAHAYDNSPLLLGQVMVNEYATDEIVNLCFDREATGNMWNPIRFSLQALEEVAIDQRFSEAVKLRAHLICNGALLEKHGYTLLGEEEDWGVKLLEEAQKHSLGIPSFFSKEESVSAQALLGCVSWGKVLNPGLRSYNYKYDFKPVRQRILDEVAKIQVASFGDDLNKWQLFSSLSENYTDTVTNLFKSCEMLSQ